MFLSVPTELVNETWRIVVEGGHTHRLHRAAEGEGKGGQDVRSANEGFANWLQTRFARSWPDWIGPVLALHFGRGRRFGILALRFLPTRAIIVVTTTLVVASFYTKATTMPDTVPNPATIPAAPARLPVDLFFDQVVQAVRHQEARLSPPFSYDLSATAGFTGLPVRLLRSMCRDTELQAIKLSGWWFLHRDEFNRLLAPDVTLPSRAARQYILLRNLQQLAAMLHPYDADPILRVLLRDLRRGTMFRGDDAAYEDAGDFAWRRAEWRVRDSLVDADQTEEALGLLRTIIALGMELLRDIDWRHSRLVSMIAEQTGIDLGPCDVPLPDAPASSSWLGEQTCPAWS